MKTETTEVTPIDDAEINPTKPDKIITKTKLSIKHDPRVRMSYIVPEEIYPENIDL